MGPVLRRNFSKVGHFNTFSIFHHVYSMVLFVCFFGFVVVVFLSKSHIVNKVWFVGQTILVMTTHT